MIPIVIIALGVYMIATLWVAIYALDGLIRTRQMIQNHYDDSDRVYKDHPFNIVRTDTTWGTLRTVWARLFLASPLWPLLLLYVLARLTVEAVKGVIEIIRDAR